MTEQGGDPGDSWRQLVADIVDDLTEDTPYGRMIEHRRFYESIRRLRPRFSMPVAIYCPSASSPMLASRSFARL